jgi:DnaJ like chaperone protein
MNDLKLSKNWIYYLIGAFIAYRVGGPIAAIISFLLIRQILIRWQEQSPNKENGVGFELALLKLSSMLIKSDGVVDHSEVSFVQEFFKKTFGAQKSKMLFKQLKEVKLPTDISLLVSLIKNEIRDDGYFSILQFLFALASIDGSISKDEDEFINTVGLNFNFRAEQINQIRNQFIKQKSSSNKYSPEVIEHLGVLGLKEGVDMDAIKKAYKTLAKEFHPDKLSGMSEGMQNLGKEKFQQILNSYNYLKAHYI